MVNLGIPGEITIIMDSILDWKDEDNLRRLTAQKIHYESLPAPYKAKNGNFDTLEELLCSGCDAGKYYLVMGATLV